MKSHLLVLLGTLAMVGCSVSKPVAPQNIDAGVEQQLALPKKEVQEKIFALLYSSNLQEIDTQLTSLDVQNFSFLDSSGDSPADLLFKIDDVDKTNIFLKHGLSIYQSATAVLTLNTDSIQLAEQFLQRDRNDVEKRGVEFRKEKSNRTFNQKNFDRINDFIDADNATEAILFSKSLKMTCHQLYIGTVLSNISKDNRSNTKSVTSFLDKIGCNNSISTEEASQLYKLEARRTYQDRFKDISLFLHVTKLPSLHDKMLSLGKHGIKVSPWYLIKLGSDCKFNKENVSPVTDVIPTDKSGEYFYSGIYCDGWNKFHDGNKNGKFGMEFIKFHNALDPRLESCREKELTKECVEEVGVAQSNYDLMLYDSEGKVLLALKGMDEITSLKVHIEGLIYGFSDRDDVWRDILEKIFEKGISSRASNEDDVK
ncbi:hypothetical protein B9G69_001650 [Bdellovibrio sp. SKB1291214]|uniref:hypothetical protein n=1 Tax=Bdellovibrio sp. SKB1291214 TaxID=1732569 RepID=UPI000B51D4F1|nr:hypothetical protein [Bdellovibrio sp. SKB1291214]UYL09278.1 hypothetical protein B9G69_001650 [Bdellovibrio sp. SKB1291214]